jgi:hypothetical protein
MKQTLTIPETFLGVGYTKDRAGLPLEAVHVPVPRPVTRMVRRSATRTFFTKLENANRQYESLRLGPEYVRWFVR